MQFRIGGRGGGPLIGCGSLLALLGLILLTPVGVWLVTAIGWISIVLGLIFVVSGIYYWLRGYRNRYF